MALQRSRGALARLARADDHYAALGQIAENLPSQLHRDGANRDVPARDRRARTHRLRRRERGLEQPVEPLARLAVRVRNVIGVLELPKDLRLAHDHRLQAGRDGVEMLHASHIAHLERQRREVVRYRVKMAQELRPRLRRALRVGGCAEVLNAVAGRDQHRLAQAEHALDLEQRVGQLRIAERHLFAQLHRHLVKGQPSTNNVRALGIHSQLSCGKTCASLRELMPQNVSRIKT